MTVPHLTPAAFGIIDWLGDLGPRWGLPADACRVHALLYLVAQPVDAGAIAASLSMESARVDAALAWLSEDRLVTATDGGWATDADPWTLMLRALEARRARELAPARAVLNAWRTDHASEDPAVARQATRLLDLVENIAAIDAGARRLSPDTVRRLVGVGGRAARLIDRAFNRGGSG
jgi:DNA-binding transcriptional regulator GbsR (MarR family)